MVEALKHVPDVSTFAANVVVFLAAVAAAVIGALSAVKKIKEAWTDTAGTKTSAIPLQTQVIGGMLQDAVGSAMMAEQLRSNQRATESLCEELREVRIVLNRIADRMGGSK